MDAWDVRLECLKLAQAAEMPGALFALTNAVEKRARAYTDFVFETREWVYADFLLGGIVGNPAKAVKSLADVVPKI